MQTPIYKRVLLKLSGEALKHNADSILDFSDIDQIIAQIARCVQAFRSPSSLAPEISGAVPRVRTSTAPARITWECWRLSSIPLG